MTDTSQLGAIRPRAAGVVTYFDAGFRAVMTWRVLASHSSNPTIVVLKVGSIDGSAFLAGQMMPRRLLPMPLNRILRGAAPATWCARSMPRRPCCARVRLLPRGTSTPISS